VPPIPTFIGIGAQKSATTWTHLVLNAHPQVLMPARKEIDFFSFNYLRGFDWYRRQFGDAGSRITGEISPSYLCAAEAPRRAHGYDPELRVVVVLRDPVARAFSNHVHEVRKGDYRSSDRSFEAGLAQNPMYVEQSLYGKHLGRWLEWFDADRLLVLFQEEIAREPAQAVRTLYGFVGADSGHETPLAASRAHENVGYRSEALKSGLRGMGSLARRFGLERAVETAKRAPLIGTLYRRNRRDFRHEIPPMTRATRQRLADLFADDVDRLSRLLGGRALPWPTWRTAQMQGDGKLDGRE
jgi:hypothetical protein